jgi:hypothetical protein
VAHLACPVSAALADSDVVERGDLVVTLEDEEELLPQPCRRGIETIATDSSMSSVPAPPVQERCAFLAEVT